MAKNEQRTQRPIAVSTLTDLRPRNRLDAFCTRCHHSQRLDVQALAAWYGPLPLARLRQLLKCGQCGARQPEIRLSWDNS
jgi:hypothetical protein